MNEGLASEEEYACMQAASPDLAGDVMRYKSVAPGGELLAAHEGPLSRALVIGSDPLLSPAVPASDLNLDDYGVARMLYAKGATVFYMVRYAMDQLMGPLGDFWLPALNSLLEKHQYSTMMTSDIFEASREVVEPVFMQVVGPGKDYYYMYWAMGFINRAHQIAPAVGNLTLERIMSTNMSAPGENQLSMIDNKRYIYINGVIICYSWHLVCYAIHRLSLLFLFIMCTPSCCCFYITGLLNFHFY